MEEEDPDKLPFQTFDEMDIKGKTIYDVLSIRKNCALI